MGRKSSNLDKKMIEAGVALLKKHGAVQLSVREVAKKAGVNLGMFSYHFGTRERFILLALNEIYQGFIADLSGPENNGSDLEETLFQIAKFSRDNREILVAILADVFANEATVTKFLRKNFTKHFEVLASALEKYLQKSELILHDRHHAMRYLIGSTGVPNILLEVYNRGVQKKVRPESDQELKKRVNAALSGLRAGFCETKRSSVANRAR